MLETVFGTSSVLPEVSVTRSYQLELLIITIVFGMKKKRDSNVCDQSPSCRSQTDV